MSLSFSDLKWLFLNRANIIDDWTEPEFYAAFELTYVPESKIASVYKMDMYQGVVRHQLNKTEPPLLLKDRFMLESSTLKFHRHHFLFDIFDRKLQQYIEADLINYNLRRWNERANQKMFEEYKEPFSILTFAELEAGFVVCLFPLVLSLLAFVIEWICSLKDSIVFLFVFKTYLEVKRN